MEGIINRMATSVFEDITKEGRSLNPILVGGPHSTPSGVDDLIISTINRLYPEYKDNNGVKQQIVGVVNEKLRAEARGNDYDSDDSYEYELELEGGARYTRRKKTKRKKSVRRKSSKRKKSVRRKSSKRKKIRKH